MFGSQIGKKKVQETHDIKYCLCIIVCTGSISYGQVESNLISFLNRHILAALHFNENVRREKQQSEAGETIYKVFYPKYKLGEEVVREVVKPPSYGMYSMCSEI